jgi:tetratricopeptide (TPR) repeat protein/predicted aspartyl protease
MLNRIRVSLLLVLLGLPCGGLRAETKSSCQLAQITDLPIKLDGHSTLVAAKINGVDAQFRLDSGAFWSLLSLAATKQYGLSVNYHQVEGLTIVSAGGSMSVGLTTVKNFTVFDVPFKYMDFIVVGEQLDASAVGLIGQNLLRAFDIDYDLGHSQVRLFIPKDCAKSMLAYWTAPGDKLSVVTMERTNALSPHTTTPAYLNGEKIRTTLDTGASTSMLTLEAARHAGLTPASAGVVPGGSFPGLGGRMVDTWIGRFKSFKIGEEEIQNARLRFADVSMPGDMLLGDDFFLSHRIMVSNSQHQVYITYAGGPVFDLRTKPASPIANAASAAGSTTGAAPAIGEQPQDAAGYAQRGAVYAARNMLDRALSDLDRASELAPDNIDYRLARGRLRWRTHQFDLALEDFEHALKAQPDNVDALLAHATVKVYRRDFVAAGADLDRLQLLLPSASEQRIELARLNMAARRPEASIPQFDQWIQLHPDDAELPEALNGRCWARALLGRDPNDIRLDDALKDCNSALRSRPETAAFLDSRALVYFRRAKWDRAIEDYNAALARQPKLAWSLYCRGIARIRKGMKSDGQADIDAATAIDAHITEDAGYDGIAP